MKNQYKIRWIALYYSILLYAGMATAVLGPSLLNLIDQTGSSLKEMSMIFPARAAAFLVGSWLAGLLYDRSRGHRLLRWGTLIMAVTFILVPFQSNHFIVILLVMTMAVATGLVDVGSNTLIFRIRNIKLGAVMNGLHLFYGIGSFFAPLILIGSLTNNDSIQYAYWGLGLFSLVILGQLINLPGPAKITDADSVPIGAGAKIEKGKSILVLIISIFFFAFVGVEIGFGDWLSTYSIQSGLTDNKTAILLTSVYWGSFTAGRVVSIPMALKYKPKQILFMDVIGGIIAMVLLYFFPGSITILWIGSILLGLSLAAIFPTILTYAESLMTMTGKLTSIFYISGSIGSIVLPWIIGRLIEVAGPILIIQALTATMFLAVISFSVLMYITRRNPQK